VENAFGDVVLQPAGGEAHNAALRGGKKMNSLDEKEKGKKKRFGHFERVTSTIEKSPFDMQRVQTRKWLFDLCTKQEKAKGGEWCRRFILGRQGERGALEKGRGHNP